MPLRRRDLPEVGELVVGTVKAVYDYGAYLSLDEYGGIEAYLPWSEVASRWVRSIEEAVKPGQKVVVKVIRVYPARKQVDVSLKRVTDSERRRKMAQWKREQKALKILEIVASKLGKDLDDAIKEVGVKLEDTYGEVMAAFEEAAIRGPDVLRKAGVPEDWIEPLIEEIRRHVEVRKVRISGIFTLRSLAPDGVKRIKEVLNEVEKKIREHKDVDVKLYTVGAPRYRIDVIAYDYKTAEKVLAKALEAAEAVAKKLGVEYSFTRVD